MLSVKDAAQAALNYYKDIYPDTNGELIEEVEMDADHSHWLITLSFPISTNQASATPISSILFNKDQRKYKIFRIDAENGHIESMKIRTLEHGPS